MRKKVILFWAIAALLIVVIGRMYEWDGPNCVLPNPRNSLLAPSFGYTPPEDQTFESAWGGAIAKAPIVLTGDQVALSDVERDRFASHPSVDPRTEKWNPPAWEAQLKTLRGQIGNFPEHLASVLKLSDGLFESPQEPDFRFFSTRNTRKDWSLLTSNQMMEMKSRLDRYLSKITELVDRFARWTASTSGLQTDFIPIAYSPESGLLLCLEPVSDLLFVVGNNESNADTGLFTFQPEASLRVMIVPTDIRLKTVLDKGPCNDADIIPGDAAISSAFIERLRNAQMKHKPNANQSAETDAVKFFDPTLIMGCLILGCIIVYCVFDNRRLMSTVQRPDNTSQFG